MSGSGSVEGRALSAIERAFGMLDDENARDRIARWVDDKYRLDPASKYLGVDVLTQVSTFRDRIAALERGLADLAGRDSDDIADKMLRDEQ